MPGRGRCAEDLLDSPDALAQRSRHDRGRGLFAQAGPTSLRMSCEEASGAKRNALRAARFAHTERAIQLGDAHQVESCVQDEDQLLGGTSRSHPFH